MTIKFPVARNHPILHAAPTFRPIRRGRRRTGLVKSYSTPKGTLEISMFYELDIADQDLMLAIFAIARAQSRGKLIEANNEENELLTGLELDLVGTEDIPVHEMPSLQIAVTRYELLTELERPDNNTAYAWLEMALNRLSKVGFFYSGAMWSGSFNMINWSSNNNSGQIKIIINPISSRSIMIDNDGYINIHRKERHSLTSDDEKALHSSLCGLVSPGTKRTLLIDTLSDRVYATYDDETTSNMVRLRRGKMKAAAASVGDLRGWNIAINGKGKDMMITVSRASFKK